MKVTTAVINKISTILDIFENDIFRHFDTIFALDIFDIFVGFRHVVTTLKKTQPKKSRRPQLSSPSFQGAGKGRASQALHVTTLVHLGKVTKLFEVKY